ncbi:hypothetical protein NH8B_3096 [Pseudogulbenkiania sp. NH8B]|uniref:DUF6515 family protein n=1 Tax=Pseudogulbenkiania sp. (strain NH8B) TaxID=748280 RepID=UPI000227A011|nr:DUF6515 family protein [Pseudogulbenkiania sp. NH8B]BAK77877.1 hypothetical protein NH8B_3096 [Pseudogulbenkiania sp. NH8B]
MKFVHLAPVPASLLLGLLLAVPPALAAPPQWEGAVVTVARPAFPARGAFVGSLPGGGHAVVHGGVRYHYYDGFWYRPRGRGYVVVSPPRGVWVPVLPLLYTTLLIGGVTYYLANDVYYVQRSDGYVVVDPPLGQGSSGSSSARDSTDLFIYPNRGQDEQQQARDRYECHRWARGQTGYDPTLPEGGVDARDAFALRDQYRRAMGACLEGRHYTVR